MGSHFIALGTAQFGGPYGIANSHGIPSDREIARILELARENGIDFLDTAIAYGDSEQRLGRVGLEGFRVVTKLPSLGETGATKIGEKILGHVAASLQRLKIDSLYALLLHSPGELKCDYADEIKAALLEVKIRGFAEKVGISAYRPHEVFDNVKLLESGIIQAPVNVFDRRFLDRHVLETLKHQGCELIARSPFLQGLLLMETDKIDRRFVKWMPLFQRFSVWCESQGISAVTACLSVFRDRHEISHAVVGVEKPSQLHQILDAWSQAQKVPCFPEFTDDEALLLPINWFVTKEQIPS